MQTYLGTSSRDWEVNINRNMWWQLRILYLMSKLCYFQSLHTPNLLISSFLKKIYPYLSVTNYVSWSLGMTRIISKFWSQFHLDLRYCGLRYNTVYQANKLLNRSLAAQPPPPNPPTCIFFCYPSSCAVRSITWYQNNNELITYSSARFTMSISSHLYVSHIMHLIFKIIRV